MSYHSRRCLRSLPTITAIVSCLLLALPFYASGQEPVTDSVPADTAVVIEAAPPTTVLSSDHKYDDGDQINLSWVPSIDETLKDSKVIGYKIYRAEDGGEFELLAEIPDVDTTNAYADQEVEHGHKYAYYVASVTETGEYASLETMPLEPEREWLDLNKAYLFIMALIISGAVIIYVETAKRGKELFVRKIAGLEAIDDAVGRATEMGRPVLFIPGIHDMDDVQTLAALTILGRVARTIADYDTKIFMPVSRSLVMTAARETIKSSYQAAGRPDAYNDDMVNYVTDEQFGYVAAVDGIMVREKPATVFLLGAFFAESLILAETGNSVGAIQIAGTARPAQLPFFIAACDFTLIGEELFAASAYLSGEPRQLGSLKGQDVGKAIAMVVIIGGVATATLAGAWQMGFAESIHGWLMEVFSTN